MNDDLGEAICVNMDDGRLVFESRETLTEEERERADFHVGYCPACQTDVDVEYFLNHVFQKNNSRF